MSNVSKNLMVFVRNCCANSHFYEKLYIYILTRSVRNIIIKINSDESKLTILYSNEPYPINK